MSDETLRMTDEEAWAKARSAKWSTRSPPPEWPSHLKPISTPGLALFGINPATGRLYWDGQELQIRQTISLRWIELTLAFVVALAAVASAVAQWMPIICPAAP